MSPIWLDSLIPLRTGPATRRETFLPAWLLVPGLAVLALSATLLHDAYKGVGRNGLDTSIYQGAAAAFLAGEPIYDQTFAGNMPYTYPPVSLLAFAPLAHVSLHRAVLILAIITVATTMLTVWCALGLVGCRHGAGRVGAAAAVTGLALWLQPYIGTFDFGQVNTVLMALVIVDFALPERWRVKGALIGVATALKLTPGLFILYLLVTRRFRAALTAVGGFIAMTALGWVIAPGDSNRYWLDAVFLNANRVAGSQQFTSANQSLASTMHRWLGHQPSALLEYSLMLVVVVIGMLLASRAYGRGEELAGIMAVAFTALLVSPVSWFHHWIWITPLLVLLADAVRRARGWTMHLLAGLTAAVVAAFFAWPWAVEDAGLPLFTRGLIWLQPQPSDWVPEPPRLALEIAHAAYVLTALELAVVAAWWLRPLRARVVEGAPPIGPSSWTVPQPRSSTEAISNSHPGELPERAITTVEDRVNTAPGGRVAEAPDHRG